MCTQPDMIPQVGPVACRKCERCLNNRLNDYVGRCIAESKTATATFAVTLTYRDEGNGFRPVYLQYDDVQRFLKRLRKKYRVRYLVAGEYGSKRGRAHWHIVLFFYDGAPEVVDWSVRNPDQVCLPRWDDDPKARIDWRYWPHGFSYFQRPDAGGFRYVCKYMLKDDTEGTAVRRPMMSKVPALGTYYLRELAERMASEGLHLRSWEYTFPEAVFKNGNLVRFWMQGAARREFAVAYERAWIVKYGEAPPQSDALDKVLDEEFKRRVRRHQLHVAAVNLIKDSKRDPRRPIPDADFDPLVRFAAREPQRRHTEERRRIVAEQNAERFGGVRRSKLIAREGRVVGRVWSLWDGRWFYEDVSKGGKHRWQGEIVDVAGLRAAARGVVRREQLERRPPGRPGADLPPPRVERRAGWRQQRSNVALHDMASATLRRTLVSSRGTTVVDGIGTPPDKSRTGSGGLTMSMPISATRAPRKVVSL